MRPLFLLVLVLFAPLVSAQERPSRADLQKALALHERSVVKVRGARGSGPGIIVGSGGQVLTSVRHVRLDSAQVVYEGQTLPATVLASNAFLKVAIVAAPSGSYPAVPVWTSTSNPIGQWLIGIVSGRGKQQDRPEAALARAAPEPFIDVDLALPPGSPLFDAHGKLVAVSVQRQGRGCRALPMDHVKQLVTQVSAP